MMDQHRSRDDLAAATRWALDLSYVHAPFSVLTGKTREPKAPVGFDPAEVERRLIEYEIEAPRREKA